MPKETKAELFMRILTEELDAHRVITKSGFSQKFKAQAQRFKQRCKPAPALAMDPAEPPDCLQMMSMPLARRRG